MAFVHLHVHSQYSVLDGTMDPKDLAVRAAALGMPAIALTDTSNLFGAVAFFSACKEKGVKPILGAELHVQPEGVGHSDPREAQGGYQIVALVEDAEGYASLCWLITQAIFEGQSFKPRIDLSMLRARHAGLIVLTGGLRGAFGGSVGGAEPEEGRERLGALAEILGPKNLFVELQDVGLPGQEEINAAGRSLARELGLLTVVTNAVHYDRPEDAAAHEVLHAIALGQSLGRARVSSPTDQAYLKTEAELREVFPDDGEAIERTVEIAARCHHTFTFGQFHFPATTPPDAATEGGPADTDANWAYFFEAFPPPLWFELPGGTRLPPRPEGAGNLDGYFAWYTRMGLAIRLRDVEPALYPAYEARMRYELGVIADMGFAAYFLIVAEFINWSKDHGIPVGPGRGSAAGSLAAFAAGITDIDPIRFDLLFERFLNPGRKSMPDIDVDFCQDRREEVIAHVRDKYGAPLVSQIITYGSLKAKAAVRDVARVLELGFDDADRLAKLIPDDLGATLDKALVEVDQLARVYEADPKVRRVIDTARRIEGLCRQTGVHAAGVVIADRPLVEYAPLYRDGPEGGPVVQFDMKSAEKIGLIKFDFLGLKTLDQIRDAMKMVEENTGRRIDLARIPVDDPATYRLLQEGDGLGVFQLESGGMRDLLTRLKPTVLDDIVALVALYRPGPLQSGMVADFVDRKHGRQEVRYPHDMLAPILQNTYGTIVYQEQVMQIAQVMGGYNLGDADNLRRAMGKKDAAEMAKQRDRFVEGSVAHGVDRDQASGIFDLLAKFAEYGFNKSHSAAYGLVCYQTAWLKANHRAEYMAALMTIESGNTDKILIYIQDCRRAGLQILPVCVNGSQRQFSVPKEADGKVIRFGLAAVKNVGEGSIQAILEARGDRPFRDPLDFFERVDPKSINKRVAEGLVKAGALDFSGVERSVLMAALDELVAEGARRREEVRSGQAVLFGGPVAVRAFRYPEAATWPLVEKMQFEREVLGLYLTGHPLHAYQDDVRRHATATLADLESREAGEEVRVIVLPSEIRTTKTRRGDRMAIVTLEDDRASRDSAFFPEAWNRSQRALRTNEPVLVVAKVEKDGDTVKLIGQSAEPISEVRARTVREVRLHVDRSALDERRVRALREALVRERGERPVRLVVQEAGRFTATYALEGTLVRPAQSLVDEVVAIFGKGATVSWS